MAAVGVATANNQQLRVMISRAHPALLGSEVAGNQVGSFCQFLVQKGFTKVTAVNGQHIHSCMLHCYI
jgi:hypothetical protein